MFNNLLLNYPVSTYIQAHPLPLSLYGREKGMVMVWSRYPLPLPIPISKFPLWVWFGMGKGRGGIGRFMALTLKNTQRLFSVNQLTIKHIINNPVLYSLKILTQL